MAHNPASGRSRVPDAGDVLQLDVEKPTAGGRMLARHDGLVVLVSGAIPGERVAARVDRVRKGLAYAETVDVLSPSQDRRPAADSRCGGQALAHITYARQVRLKGEIVQDALTRIGRIALPAAPDVVPSPETGYRMRSRLHVRHGRIGFFREGSHEVCDAVATGQLSPATNAWLTTAQRFLTTTDALSGLLGVELAENLDATQRAAHLELDARTSLAPFDALAAGLTGLSASRTGLPRTTTLAGSPIVADVIRAGSGATLRLERDVRAFFQGNRFLLQPLVTHVLSSLGSGRVVDLYAGVGVFGLAAAAGGAEHVALIEADPVSGASLRVNAQPFANRATPSMMTVEHYLASARSLRNHQVVIDPPRTGLSRAALSDLVRALPDRIVYVSCDVATLARDLRLLLDAGYGLQHVSAFDLFPNTAHIETVAVVHRTEIGDG